MFLIININMNSDLIEYVLSYHNQEYLLEKKRYKKHKMYILKQLNLLSDHISEINTYKETLFNLYHSLKKNFFMPKYSASILFNKLSFFFNTRDDYLQSYDAILCLYIELYDYFKKKNIPHIYVSYKFKHILLN